MVPDDPFDQAQALRWMFFEQYSHEPYIAVARYWLYILGQREDHADRLPDIHKRGYHALGVMDQHLGDNDFFACGRYSIADIALYAYTHMAGDGDFDVGHYKNVTAWLARVSAQPGHITIDWRP